jgi:hypothetical protein
MAYQTAHPHADGDDAVPEDTDIGILHEACWRAQFETVRFLLSETQSQFGGVHARYCGKTPILKAASMFKETAWSGRTDRKTSPNEDLIQWLLDIGANAGNVQQHPHIQGDTILDLLIPQSSPSLTLRLIRGGANVHAKTDYGYQHFFFHHVSDVTPTHIGSFYANIDGLRALAVKRGSGVAVADMLSG